MHIDHLLDTATDATRRLKEHVTRDGPVISQPLIQVWRGDNPIAVIALRDHHSEEILATAHVCAVGFDADFLAISLEGYVGVGTAFVGQHINPQTGQRWHGNEMQEVAEHHDGIAKGWVAEAIVVNVVTRAGDLATRWQVFSYGPDGLRWGKSRDRSTLDSKWKPSGVMPEALIKIMLTPSSATAFPYGNESVERSVRDAEVAQMLTSDKCVVALYADRNDIDRIKVISEIGVIVE